MKKILLFLVLVLAAINVAAQEQVIYYKKYVNQTYFRVATEGKADEYYSTFNQKTGISIQVSLLIIKSTKVNMTS